MCWTRVDLCLQITYLTWLLVVVRDLIYPCRMHETCLFSFGRSTMDRRVLFLCTGYVWWIGSDVDMVYFDRGS